MTPATRGTSAGPTARSRDIPALTGLRGVAAVWVAAYHLLLPAALVGGLPARLLGRGYLAVDLFFVLSGFVMALTYGHLFAGSFRPRAFTAFLWRRVARLYPLYAAILLARLLYTAARYGTYDLPRPWIATPLPHPWADIPANLLLVQSWGLAPSAIGPAWSISTEWGAYFAFPLLAAITLHGRPRLALTGAACCAAALLLTAALLHQDGRPVTLDAWNGQTPTPVLRCLAGFTLGLGAWRLSRNQAAARLASRAAVSGTVLLALPVLLAVGAPDLAVYPLFPATVLCLATGRTLPAGLFARALPVWLGEISYALYLLHIFLLHPLDQARATLRQVLPAGPADLLAVLSVGAVLLAASDLAYRAIEVPGRRMLTATMRS